VLRFPLILLPKALRCVSEAINASANIEKFLVEPVVPKQNTEGRPGVKFTNVSPSRSRRRKAWALSAAGARARALHGSSQPPSEPARHHPAGCS
jgi:hypothetical protein